MKEDYDGAEPTASSISVLNLLVLSHLLEEPRWAGRIERTFKYFATRLEQMGRGVPMMASALSAHLSGMRQVVIVGDETGDGELSRRRRAAIPAVCRDAQPVARAAAGPGVEAAVHRVDDARCRRRRRVRLPPLHLPCAYYRCGGTC